MSTLGGCTIRSWRGDVLGARSRQEFLFRNTGALFVAPKIRNTGEVNAVSEPSHSRIETVSNLNRVVRNAEAEERRRKERYKNTSVAGRCIWVEARNWGPTGPTRGTRRSAPRGAPRP